MKIIPSFLRKTRKSFVVINTIVMKKAFEDMATYSYSCLITNLCLLIIAYRCYSRPSKHRRSFNFPRQSLFEAPLCKFPHKTPKFR